MESSVMSSWITETSLSVQALAKKARKTLTPKTKLAATKEVQYVLEYVYSMCTAPSTLYICVGTYDMFTHKLDMFTHKLALSKLIGSLTNSVLHFSLFFVFCIYPMSSHPMI